jgi:hypothetical protein
MNRKIDKNKINYFKDYLNFKKIYCVFKAIDVFGIFLGNTGC